jgi:Transglycosylase SLT domain
MAGGHLTFPCRSGLVSEPPANVQSGIVAVPAAWRFLLFILSLAVSVAEPANRSSPVSQGISAPRLESTTLPRSAMPVAEIVLGVGIKFRTPPETALFDVLAAARSELDRIAAAVEIVESSGGKDPLMWRSNLDGPQGPMQVSQAAATDVGGGNRWDPNENRALGRAYLAKLHERFGNWSDAVMAYNWGPGNLDLWIRGGRAIDEVVPAVATYRDRVIRDTGIPTEAAEGAPSRTVSAAIPRVDADSQDEDVFREDRIKNRQLRLSFHQNSETIRRLQGLLDAIANLKPGRASDRAVGWLGSADIDARLLARGESSAVRQMEEAGARLVLTTVRSLSGRPGYEVFDALANAKSINNLKLDVARQIASIVVAKLRSENALIAVLDARGSGMPLTKDIDRR